LNRNAYNVTTQGGVEVTCHRITGGPFAGQAWGYARTDPKPGVIRDIPAIWATITRDGRDWVIAPASDPYYTASFSTLREALACLGRWAVAEWALNAEDRTYSLTTCL
jgi:hypothetical protein